MEKKREGLPLIREKTIQMSQITEFGLEIALAKMRNTNPELYEYLEKEHPFATMLSAPVYHIIQLEYELRREVIPRVTRKILEEIVKQPPSLPNVGEKIAKQQPYFAKTLREYLKILTLNKQNLATPAQSAIYKTYAALEKQALSERPSSY